MPINKPFYRTYRPNNNTSASNMYFVQHQNFADDPLHYIRAFKHLQSDIIDLFHFIEPSDINLKTYSFKIHELFVRTCIEIESNFKAIMRENNYKPIIKSEKKGPLPKKEHLWNFNDYKKINKSHHLSSYEVLFPYWGDNQTKIFTPFIDLISKDSPNWYKEYHSVKHNRVKNFKNANYENLLNAFSGLFVVLTSQFKQGNIKAGLKYLGGISGETPLTGQGEFHEGIGNFLLIKLPQDWGPDEYYDFNWRDLEQTGDPFQHYDYNV